MSPAKVKTKPTRANRKCIECNRIVAATGLTCSTCFLFIHPKCTKLPPTELRSVIKNPPAFVCQYTVLTLNAENALNQCMEMIIP